MAVCHFMDFTISLFLEEILQKCLIFYNFDTKIADFLLSQCVEKLYFLSATSLILEKACICWVNILINYLE